MRIHSKYRLVILAAAVLAFVFLTCRPVSAADFTTWNPVTSDIEQEINGIWGDGAGVFAVGKAGVIVYYDGAAWTSMTSGAANDLSSVWGTDGTDVFAAGKSGVILHYDGSAWSSMNSGTTADLNGIWGSDNSNIFAVGKSGGILHYDGSGWSPMSSGTTRDLTCVWGAGSDVFTAGKSGVILKYNGSSWSSLNSSTTADLNSIWGSSGTDVFVAGNSGTILRYNGSVWRSLNSGTASDLYAIWGAGRSAVFVVGKFGTISFFNGAVWSPMNSDNQNDLRAVWGRSPVDVFAAGASGAILRFAPPVIDTLVPDRGDQGASLDVNIYGTNLADASEVSFGAGIAVTSFTVVGPERIKARIKIVAGAGEGPRDVSVTTPGGTNTLPDSFEVIEALPVITSLNPDQNVQGAAVTVTISGAKFTGASEVSFGAGIAVDSFTVISATRIEASITIIPGAVIGTRDVSVTTPAGRFTLPGSFTIRQALPAITSVSPDQDRQGTTLNVTITGANFDRASEVSFGPGISVNSFTVISSNQIAAGITLAANAVTGAKDVSVVTPAGSYTLSAGFTVKQALPVITSVSPGRGNQKAALTVTLAGANLGGASQAQFGAGIAVNSLTVISSNQVAAGISIAAGAGTGSRDVSVTTPGGSFTLPNGFTVIQALPVISSISPDSGSQGATLDITINGTDLTGANEVRFGTGIALNSFNILNAHQISANITILAGTATGSMDITVSTPGGSFTLPGGFVVKQGLPRITSISPTRGDQGATVTVIISGRNFEGVTSVSFGSDVAVLGFNTLSPTQISVNLAVDGSAVTGVRDVSVTTTGGATTLSNSFTIKEPSLGILIIALIWVGIAVVVVVFIVVLNILRKKRYPKV